MPSNSMVVASLKYKPKERLADLSSMLSLMTYDAETLQAANLPDVLQGFDLLGRSPHLVKNQFQYRTIGETSLQVAGVQGASCSRSLFG